MANKGFRQECKFIEKEIGNVKILANPSGYDGNIHAVINCCNTGGKNPIDFSLIYNHSNRNENIGYGKGLLDNFYREIIISGDECIIKSSDGATYSTTRSVKSKEIWINSDENYIYDTFVLRNYNKDLLYNEVICTKLDNGEIFSCVVQNGNGTTASLVKDMLHYNVYTCEELNIVIDDYIISDSNGNQYYYNASNLKYPQYIVLSNSDKYYLEFNNGKLTSIRNESFMSGYNNRLDIVCSNNKLSEIIETKETFYEGPTYIKHLYFNFDSSNYLKECKKLDNNDSNKVLFRTLFNITDNQIMVYDTFNHYVVDYYISFNNSNNEMYIDEIEESYNSSTSNEIQRDNSIRTLIGHNNHYSEIRDRYNNYTRIYYNSYHQVAYETDRFLNVIAYRYDTERKLISKTEVIPMHKNIMGEFNILSDGYFDNASLFTSWETTFNNSLGLLNDSSRELNSIFGNNFLSFDTYNSEFTDLYQIVNYNGNINDKFTFMCWYFVLDNYDGYQPLIDFTFYLDNIEVKSIQERITDVAPSNEWLPFVCDVKPNVNFDKVKVTLKIDERFICFYFDGLVLSKVKSGLEVKYNQNGKIFFQDINGQKTNIVYNDQFKKELVVNPYGDVERYTYDNLGNVLTQENVCTRTTNTYIFTNLENSRTDSLINTDKYNEESYEYTETNETVNKIITNNNEVINISIDEINGYINNITHHDSTVTEKVHNYLGQVESLKFTSWNGVDNVSATFNYNGAEKQLSKITTPNNEIYDFTYEDGKVKKISVGVSANKSTLSNKIYDENNPDQTAEERLNAYNYFLTYYYDDYGRIDRVFYRTILSETEKNLLQYYYDIVGRVIQVKFYDDGNVLGNMYFTYDINGNVKTFERKEGEVVVEKIEYIYDEYNNLSFEKCTIKDETVIKSAFNTDMLIKPNSFDNLSEIVKYQNLNKNKYYCFFNDNTNLERFNMYDNKNMYEDGEGDERKYFIRNNNGSSHTTYNNYNNYLKYVTINNDEKKLLYSVYDKDDDQTIPSQTYSFAFKMNGNNAGKCLLELTDINGEGSSIKAIIQENNKVRVNFIRNQIIQYYVELDSPIIQSEINYFSISYQNAGNDFNCVVALNNEIQHVYYYGINYTINIWLFGGAMGDGLYCNLDVYAQMYYRGFLFPENILQFNNVIDLFKYSKRYLGIYNNYKITHVDGSLSYNFNNGTLSSYDEVIPLHNSLKSLNDKSPIIVGKRYDDSLLREKYFEYVESIKRPMYRCEASSLVYDLNFSDIGNVSFNFLVKKALPKQYLMNIKATNTNLGVFVKNDNKVYLDISGTEVATNIPFSLNTLTYFSLSWENYLDSDDTYIDVYLMVNSRTYYYNIKCDSLSNGKLILGSKDYINNYYLTGLIDMVCYKEDYLTSSSMSLLETVINPITKTNEYDEFGKLRNKYFKCNMFSTNTTYTYQSYGNKETNILTGESTNLLRGNLSSNSFNYTYSYWNSTNSKKGYLKNIKLNDETIKSYNYNYRGFLTSEDRYLDGKMDEYSYDANRNITSKVTRLQSNGEIISRTDFTYDTVWKDLLIQVGNKKIKYYDNGSGLPQYYGILDDEDTFIRGVQFTWERNRMTRYRDTINNIDVTFKYYSDGKRRSKVIGTDEIKYYYNGDLLVTEVDNNTRKDYIYDNNSLLIGLKYKNSYGIIKTYYYIRDALGNINGLIDENGYLVVEYKYDAYGNNLGIIDNSNNDIGDINPFRYKGYYYDVETNLALVSSRYYSPELGRFIQPADVSSLNPQSINGLNLYAYANNNPISFSYNNSSAVGSTNVAGGLVSSIGTGNSFVGNVNSGSPSKGGLNLDWLKNGLDTGSTIHGLYTSISGLVNHTAYFAKNLTPFADDMTMLGASMKDGVLAFNQFSWGLGKSDIFGIALGVGLDIYDSIQREVSPSGVVLGATLTAAKGVGLIYLNKGILYGATALGSAICPGVGTVVGFVVGGIVCIVVDIFASNWLDDLIDKIAK